MGMAPCTHTMPGPDVACVPGAASVVSCEQAGSDGGGGLTAEEMEAVRRADAPGRDPTWDELWCMVAARFMVRYHQPSPSGPGPRPQ